MRAEKDGDRGIWRFSKPVLVATQCYPPLGGGSSTIMVNLLNWIEPDSIVLAVQKPDPETEKSAPVTSHRRYFVEWSTRLPGRIEQLRRYLTRPVVEHGLVALGLRMDCGAVVGVYPDVFFLDAACCAARRLGVPFIPHLHDTVEEGMASSRFGRYACHVQKRVFSSSKTVLVANQGMAALYREKYGINAVPVVHVYPERVPRQPPAGNGSRDLFWSGNIYSINAAALGRVYEASSRVPGTGLTVASQQSLENLARLGLGGERVRRTYVPVRDRQRYLDLLRSQGVLLLALSWPDESPVHEDELRTIFPTKTPEYLASGRPILVHCPEHYYLARFFTENRCGEVVTERNVDVLEMCLRLLLEDQERRRRLGEAALAAAHEFKPKNVLPVFHSAVQGILDHV